MNFEKQYTDDDMQTKQVKQMQPAKYSMFL